MTSSSGTRKRLISLGACVVDAIMRVDKVPAGDAKVLAEDGMVIGAGMAVAAACAAAAMGGDVSVWGRIGGDRIGDFFLADLEDAGVDTSFIHRAQGARTAVSSVIVDGEGQRLVVPYFDTRLGADASWLPIEQLDSADCVLADVRWPEGSRRILNEAKKRGLIRIFDGDVATPEILRELAPLSTHAIFSEPGFRLFSGREEILEVLPEFAARFDGCLGVTLGEHGFAWVEEGVVRTVPAPKVDVLDTLAAGDVFHGAFALAISEGMSVVDAGRFGCAAAAIKCSRFGGRTGAPTRVEVEALVRETY
ncbi:MAG: PfkB family carbohydrate kinase [Alphaproteobacteria bacterium]|nr:PfkB family carbohydrate kinase [Alphaproteobacteria bacterium]